MNKKIYIIKPNKFSKRDTNASPFPFFIENIPKYKYVIKKFEKFKEKIIEHDGDFSKISFIKWPAKTTDPFRLFMFFGAEIKTSYSDFRPAHKFKGFSNSKIDITDYKENGDKEYKLTRIYNSKNFRKKDMILEIENFIDIFNINKNFINNSYSKFEKNCKVNRKTANSLSKDDNKKIIKMFNTNKKEVFELLVIFMSSFWKIDLLSDFKMDSYSEKIINNLELKVSSKSLLNSNIENQSNNEIKNKYEKGVFDEIIIGCLDTGLNNLQFKNIETFNYINLDEGITKEDQDELSQKKDQTSLIHGSIVSSALSYGLIGEDDGIEKNFKVYNAEICYPDKFNKTDTWSSAIDRIEKAISSRRDIKIWNISLNTKNKDDVSAYNRTSELGIAMDKIQNEYDVKIILSAGNQNEENNLLYIQSPCDSILATSVSSCNIDHNKISNHSLMGFNSYKGLKPNVLFFGGDDDQSAIVPIITIGVDNNLKYEKISVQGTSFSSPLFCRIWTRIYMEIKKGNPDETFKNHAKMVDAIITNGSVSEMKSKISNMTKSNKDMDYFGEGFSFKKWNEYINNEYSESFFIHSKDKIKWSEAYTSIKIPDLKKYNYDIFITSISDIQIDNNWGVEYCRSASRSKFTFAEKLTNKKGKDVFKTVESNKNNALHNKNTKFFDFKMNLTLGKWRRKFSYHINYKKLLKMKEKFESLFPDSNAEENFSMLINGDHRVFNKDGTQSEFDKTLSPIVYLTFRLNEGDIELFKNELYNLIIKNKSWEIINILYIDDLLNEDIEF